MAIANLKWGNILHTVSGHHWTHTVTMASMGHYLIYRFLQFTTILPHFSEFADAILHSLWDPSHDLILLRVDCRVLREHLFLGLILTT
jgi:hypothetical protein